jgi:hypothetical protein
MVIRNDTALIVSRPIHRRESPLQSKMPRLPRRADSGHRMGYSRGFCLFSREIPIDQTSIYPLEGLPPASGSPSQLHLSGRAARTNTAIAGDTPASLTTRHPYPRITREELQEQFRDAASIASQNFTLVRQPIIPVSDGSLGTAPQLMTCVITAAGYLSPTSPRLDRTPGSNFYIV